MSTPRILVGMPTRGYAYAPSLLRAADLARRYGHDLLLEMGRPIELVRTRMVTRFLDSGADYLVTIDDDIVAPDDAVDRLIALGAPVSTAPCPIAVDGQILWNVKAVGSDEWMEDPPSDVICGPAHRPWLRRSCIARSSARSERPGFNLAPPREAGSLAKTPGSPTVSPRPGCRSSATARSAAVTSRTAWT